MQPSIFISHGSPMLALEETPAVDFLRGLGKTIEQTYGRPKAILCASAHWETATPAVSTATKPETIHDFYGFPEPLYRLNYPAPGAPEAAGRAAALIREAGFECVADPGQGLDHGAWMPLRFIWPAADVPVAQVALQQPLGPAHHIALGEALTPIRAEGVLVLGSGGAVHNLRALGQARAAGQFATPNWAAQFDDWLEQAVQTGDREALIRYRTPEGAMAHPRDEHLLPLHVAFGAGGQKPGRTLHRSFNYGSLSMAAYAFY